MSEHQEQVAVITWARYMGAQHPELKWLHSSLNGIVIPGTPVTRYRIINYMKSAGLKRGIADLFLPVARKGYHGLYIEMKVGKNKLTKDQQEFKEFVVKEGYAFHECHNEDEAILILKQYLAKYVKENDNTRIISGLTWENTDNFGYQE